MFSPSENQKKLFLAFFIAVLLWGYASNQTANLFNYGEEQAASFLLDIEVRNLADEYEELGQEFYQAEKPEEEAYTGKNVDIEVVVNPAPGEKCDRCWHYSPTVGENNNHQDLCSECIEVVNQL